MVQRAVGGAKPGSIILLHDIHSSTLQAVEGIVTGLQARGYTLVTVSQLMGMGRLLPAVLPRSLLRSLQWLCPARALPSSAVDVVLRRLSLSLIVRI